MKNLNIVYFVPSDLDTLPDYQSRLSDILLWVQRFYKDEMSRHGYPDKTFGMFVNSDSLVRIITIRGTNPKSAYPYEGGSGAEVILQTLFAKYFSFFYICMYNQKLNNDGQIEIYW
ncbi:hypothetical protein [Sphingobacterium thalpophilum]|uniref:hypothetical protein n=1 Tax=Sphingobacterium thalpophilum TaxID=259 RepID=UPI003D97ABEB